MFFMGFRVKLGHFVNYDIVLFLQHRSKILRKRMYFCQLQPKGFHINAFVAKQTLISSRKWTIYISCRKLHIVFIQLLHTGNETGKVLLLICSI